MISNIEIIFGLANRTKKYGIANKLADPEKISLDKLFGIGIDGVDGAENYGWHQKDLKIISKNPEKSHFTKIELIKNENLNLEEIIKKYKLDKKCEFLNGIFMHDRVSTKSIYLYKKILLPLKQLLPLKIGISIYNQEDLKIIEDNNLAIDILQLPMNINCNIDASSFVKKGCHVYARSIFLQGIFFSNYNLDLNEQVKKRLDYQKNYLNKKAKLNNMDLGQYLFSESISLCKKKKYKGIVLNSSNIKRIGSYIHNHKSLIINKHKDELGYKMMDRYLADPRLWKI